MTYAGFNIPSNSAQYLPPAPAESDAAAKNVQINLAITKDTLEVPFSEIGKDQTWKYQANSSRPTLPPVHTLRTSSPDFQLDDEGIKQKHEELLDNLPDHIKSAVVANRQMARESQITSLIALDACLTALARALVIIESGGEPLLREGAADKRRQINMQVPQYVQQNYEQNAYEMLGGVRRKMEEAGRNNLPYDDISYYSNLSEEGLGALKEGDK